MADEQKNVGKLAKKLLEVMKHASKVNKSGFNKHANYAYIMEADLLEVVRETLTEQGIMITTSVVSVEREDSLTTVVLEHTFIDTDTGATLTVKSAGQGSDKQDKGVFKAITGANKYFLLKSFLLSGDDDPEKDAGVGTINTVNKAAPSFKSKMASTPKAASKPPPKTKGTMKFSDLRGSND